MKWVVEDGVLWIKDEQSGNLQWECYFDINSFGIRTDSNGVIRHTGEKMQEAERSPQSYLAIHHTINVRAMLDEN